MIFHGKISAMWIEEDTSSDETVGKRIVRVDGAIYGPPGRDIIRPGALDASGEMNAVGPYDPDLHALIADHTPDVEP